jgi:hypothetical protein
MGGLSIVANRANGFLFAPETVVFEAEVTSPTGLPVRTNGDVGDALYDVYDPQFHELEFVWSFGHAGSFRHLSRLPMHLRAKNTGHGKTVSTVFETPGPKTVTCTAYRTSYSAGTQSVVVVARRTITLTVADIDDVVPAAQRIYVTTGSDIGGLPAGATTVTNFAGTVTPLQTFIEGGERAVFFRRGETFALGGGLTYIDGLYVGAWGDGARPVLTRPPSGGGRTWFTQMLNGGPCDRLILHDLDCRGLWDDETETRGNGPGNPNLCINSQDVCNILTAGCAFSGFDTAITCGFYQGGGAFQRAPLGPSVWSKSYGLMIWDCDFFGSRDYSVIAGTRYFLCSVGSQYRRSPNAASNLGFPGKPGNFENNTHADIRFAESVFQYVAQNEAFSRVGWTSNHLTQSCFRLLTACPQDWNEAPAQVVCYGNYCEGGVAPISASLGGSFPAYPGGPIRLARPANALYKHNFLVSAWDTIWGIWSEYGAASIVENLVILPDVPRISVTAASQTVGRGTRSLVMPYVQLDPGGAGSADNAREPCRVIGNTLLDFYTNRSSAEVAAFNGLAAFAGYTESRDNVVWRPNGVDTDTGAGPMELVGTIPPLNMRGPRIDWNDDGNFVTFDLANDGSGADFRTPSDGIRILRPRSGTSPCVGPMCRSDILGVLRRSFAPSGALTFE